MSDDETFRIVLVVGFLILFPVALSYRIRSQATRESLDRWQEGPFILFTLRPVGVASMIGLVAFMIEPSWMAWSSVPLPAWLRWTGAVVAALAGGLLLWAFQSLGPNLTDTVVTRKAHTLGHSRSISVGPTPVLRLGCTVGDRQRSARGELVRLPHWQSGSRPDRRPYETRGRQSLAPFWRFVRRLHAPNGTIPASN
jgi:hypothetical protein